MQLKKSSSIKLMTFTKYIQIGQVKIWSRSAVAANAQRLAVSAGIGSTKVFNNKLKFTTWKTVH